jgi:glycerol kinase
LLDGYNISGKDICAIGITNQRETTVVWDKNTGVPVYNAIGWQCRRTAPLCEQLVKDGLSDFISNKTGLLIAAYFQQPSLHGFLRMLTALRKKQPEESFFSVQLTHGLSGI